MSFFQEKQTKLNGITVHTVKTDKYKTNTLVLKMMAPLKKENVTKRAILPFILQRATERFRTTGELRNHLDELYGASLFADLSKKGENQIITFRMEVANEKFLSEKTPLLEEAISLLSDILLRPLLKGSAFDDGIVKEEIRTLKQRIQAAYDDKMRYSNLRLVQEMCKNEPYALHVNGEKDQADDLTAENVYEYYQQVLKEDKLDLYLIGDFEEAAAGEMVKKYFDFSANTHAYPETEQASKQHVEEKEVIEEEDVKQGKLNIGYRTNCLYNDDSYFALQVFNGIFGGFSHSKLFINVREKASLAYYAASRVESHKGLLMVMSGIEVGNYDQAVSIIKEQMAAMKNGDFTDDDLNQTKGVIRNQLLETIDTSYGLSEILYQNVAANSERTFDELLDGISHVTKEEVVESASKIELDTIYFLKGKGAQNNG
ncbi:EF-P 5-aminopentanol modification-associated protein YfmF [Bacillus sp. SJS]|uniref:EF-P 5-aminopentanol modification-associated protein YfmF n=1 Tax=Bacillus sp. SJS TaxID=1423321 RepID=UPI0004DCCC6D|nr:pitrilysin family protein [Bacillus sp. SJS]KZZ82784.1 zinc protease [Bacillus sp. SJS]